MTKQDFENLETGTDCSFYRLPKGAQEVALEVIASCKDSINPKQAIVRELDSSDDFRAEVGELDFNVLPKQVDVVVRFFELTGGEVQL